MRRFLVVNKERPDQVIGEGVVWSHGEVSFLWSEDQPDASHFSVTMFDSVETVLRVPHHPDGTAKVLWIDPTWDAPYPCKRSVNGGPYVQATHYPSSQLHDGWGSPNGACDKHGVPLHVGQQVRLLTGGTEGCGDIGEITALTVNADGKLRVTLAGVNICNQAGVDLDEIEAIETTTQQTYERCGCKPAWGWAPALTINKTRKRLPPAKPIPGPGRQWTR